MPLHKQSMALAGGALDPLPPHPMRRGRGCRGPTKLLVATIELATTQIGAAVAEQDKQRAE